jgi:HlyD family secretion protein
VGNKTFLTLAGKWMIGGSITLVLGIATLGFFQVSRHSEIPSQLEPSAQSQSGKVSALGRIEPAGEVYKVGGPSGERIGELLVKEGQYVATGEPIAVLESYAERLADKEVAQSQLDDSLVLLESEQQYGSAQISETRSRRVQADAPKLRERGAQEATIARLNSELKFAKADLSRYRKLQAEGAISERELESKRLVYQTKEEEVGEAKAKLARIDEERSTSISNVDAQVQSAQANLVRSRAQIKIAAARSNLKLAQIRLDRVIIRAPKPGQILKILLKEGESLQVSAGSSSSTTGQNIVELGNTNQMDVVAEVYETDVGRVKIGQTVTITSSAFPGKIAGKVSHIGLKIGKNDVISTDPAANTDVRVVEVRIHLLNSRPVSDLTNLQVSVEIDSRTL